MMTCSTNCDWLYLKHAKQQAKRFSVTLLIVVMFIFPFLNAIAGSVSDNKNTGWIEDPAKEKSAFKAANERLKCAIQQPEFMLKNWVALPTAPRPTVKKQHHLTLEDAILLALRYNPNIQNAELDRIIQRYQLRLANKPNA